MNIVCHVCYIKFGRKRFYNPHLWHIIAHFGKIIFMRPYIMKRRRNFVCPSVNQSNVHAHVQTKRLTASKFGIEILERIFEKTSKRFFKNLSNFFKMIKKYIFLDFKENYSFISQFFSSLRGTRGLQSPNLV